MDGSSFLLRFLVFHVFAKNEGSDEPTRAAAIGAMLAQTVGVPLALVLTRTLITQEVETARSSSENRKKTHTSAGSGEKEKAKHN
jgi:hypothetical protein